MKKNFELRYLEVRYIREALLSSKLEKRYFKLQLGYEGEKEVYIWLVEYGSNEWLIFSDLWFTFGNGTQADFVVVCDTTWVLVEVKNYDGHFRYENGECWVNDFRFKDDVMNRMEQRVRNLQNVANEMNVGIKVTGAMVFINEHCTFEVDQELNFDIVMRSGLKKYLTDLKYKHSGRLSDEYIEYSRYYIGKYIGESPFKPEVMEFSETFAGLRKGITCVKCHGFGTEVKYKKVYCRSCGASEKKSDAILRSAKQLRMMYFDEPKVVTRRNLYEFMGGGVSDASIYKTLSKNYKFKGGGNTQYYECGL